jgi:hypothetical protein
MQTEKTNLVILPSRGRPDKINDALDALKDHSRISDFIVAIDDDEADLYPRVEGITYEVNPRLRMNGTLNLVATKYASKYKTVYFLGDDHVVRTPGWDELLYAPIEARGYGLSYGDDKFQRQNLATAVMMSTNIIEILGFMSPPKLVHLYMDNFWMSLGRALNCLDYVPQAVIEHMHYAAGKSVKDDRYAEVNSQEMYDKDKATLLEYIQTQLYDDLEKLIYGLDIQ